MKLTIKDDEDAEKNRDLSRIATFDERGLRDFVRNREGLLNFVEQLRSGAQVRWPFEEISTVVKALIAEHGLNQSYLIPRELTLHRARKLDSCSRNCWFSSIRDLGPRQSSDVDDFGRCNSPGQSIGYFALYEDIALAEICADTGDCVAIATFKFVGDVIAVPVGEFDYFRRTGETYLGSAKQPYEEALAKDNLEGKQKQILDAFCTNEFRRSATRSADYKITAAISEALLNHPEAKNKIDAIFYPSVEFNAGSNMAIRCSAFHSKMQVVVEETHIYRVVQALGYGIYDLEKLATLAAVADDGTLSWR